MKAGTRKKNSRKNISRKKIYRKNYRKKSRKSSRKSSRKNYRKKIGGANEYLQPSTTNTRSETPGSPKNQLLTLEVPENFNFIPKHSSNIEPNHNILSPHKGIGIYADTITSAPGYQQLYRRPSLDSEYSTLNAVANRDGQQQIANFLTEIKKYGFDIKGGKLILPPKFSHTTFDPNYDNRVKQFISTQTMDENTKDTLLEIAQKGGYET